MNENTLSNKQYADVFEKLIPEIEVCMNLYLYEQSALHSALLALQEKAERETGCKYCNDHSFKQTGAYIDSEPNSEILGISHYCMSCGKKLTDHIGEANEKVKEDN